ncbi:Gfo/Idh/MocA family protein [Mucisphaera calidilacus]|uniref:4,5-dihydroxyphthalate dehydrogenase n=1 Tax=Mucisphaera calidilacus TaxID=2527982 RepID=A0A518BUD7_9BACT|nr:Gfo/Idh/MocA family oxidoreductase [Mucisphaera calidilacus]QDU70576.1 Putative 4,5-dihydroxyphthalate dehydrogenase [Mucisphaera calidilacus]
MSESERAVRLGVVGYGFGRFLVSTLMGMPGVRVVVVADRSSALLERDAGRYGFASEADAERLFGGYDLDAVVIATSPASRHGLLERAVGCGLGVFVEKPWASNARHARVLASVCAGSSGVVMPGFSFRFHPVMDRLRGLLEGPLGAVRVLRGSYVFDWVPPADGWLWDPEDGNGLINENSCHLFDAVCSLMGRPERVFAMCGDFHGRPMPDSAVITLGFSGGAMASLTVGGLGVSAEASFPRLEVFAEGGQAELIGQDHLWRRLRWAERGDDAVRELVADPERLGTTRYTHALEHFVHCVRSGSSPAVTVADGVLSVDIAMAVTASSRLGRAVDLADFKELA